MMAARLAIIQRPPGLRERARNSRPYYRDKGRPLVRLTPDGWKPPFRVRIAK